MSARRAGDAVALSVSGPSGAVDLLVPPGTTVAELAARYRDEVGATTLPLVFSLGGRSLPPDRTLAELGLGDGSLLVSSFGVPRPKRGGSSGPASSIGATLPAGALVALWLAVAAGLAGLAGAAVIWGSPTEEVRRLTAGLLGGAAVLGVVDVGRYAAARAAVAPVFAAAAVLVWMWRPEPEALPLVLGFAGLGGGVAAALARTRLERRDEPLLVWMVAGIGLFLIAGAAALLGLAPAVVWSVVLVLALFAARVAPGLVIDVPDQLLVDLERLAVTAWTARDPAPGRRGRTIVSPAAVADLAARGGRALWAAALASGSLAALASVLLLQVDLPLDAAGARWLVGISAAGLLLAARNHRHRGARTALRVGALAAGSALASRLLGESEPGSLVVYVVLALLAATALVLAGVATGRGWRSPWWARRAEVAENLCLAGAVAAMVVSTGAFRGLWEFGSVRFGG